MLFFWLTQMMLILANVAYSRPNDESMDTGPPFRDVEIIRLADQNIPPHSHCKMLKMYLKYFKYDSGKVRFVFEQWTGLRNGVQGEQRILNINRILNVTSCLEDEYLAGLGTKWKLTFNTLYPLSLDSVLLHFVRLYYDLDKSYCTRLFDNLLALGFKDQVISLLQFLWFFLKPYDSLIDYVGYILENYDLDALEHKFYVMVFKYHLVNYNSSYIATTFRNLYQWSNNSTARMKTVRMFYKFQKKEVKIPNVGRNLSPDIVNQLNYYQLKKEDFAKCSGFYESSVYFNHSMYKSSLNSDIDSIHRLFHPSQHVVNSLANAGFSLERYNAEMQLMMQSLMSTIIVAQSSHYDFVRYGYHLEKINLFIGCSNISDFEAKLKLNTYHNLSTNMDQVTMQSESFQYLHYNPDQVYGPIQESLYPPSILERLLVAADSRYTSNYLLYFFNNGTMRDVLLQYMIHAIAIGNDERRAELDSMLKALSVKELFDAESLKRTQNLNLTSLTATPTPSPTPSPYPKINNEALVLTFLSWAFGLLVGLGIIARFEYVNQSTLLYRKSLITTERLNRLNSL